MFEFNVNTSMLDAWLSEDKDETKYKEYIGNGFGITRARLSYVCDQAAQWGADQELGCCLKLLEDKGYSEGFVEQFKSTRRPDLTKKVVDMLTACIDNNVGVQLKPHDIKNILDLIQDLSK